MDSMSNYQLNEPNEKIHIEIKNIEVFFTM